MGTRQLQGEPGPECAYFCGILLVSHLLNLVQVLSLTIPKEKDNGDHLGHQKFRNEVILRLTKQAQFL